MLTYGLIFMIWINPYEFGGRSSDMTLYMVGSIFGITFFFPLLSLVMMRFLGMVDSFQMADREERIIPYVSTGVFYLWMSVNVYYTSVFPAAFQVYALGATTGLFTAFFVNNFTKISMHTVGAGGFLAMVVIMMVQTTAPLFDLRSILLIALIGAGAIGTARLILKAHQPKDIYQGYAVGFATQFIALAFLG